MGILKLPLDRVPRLTLHGCRLAQSTTLRCGPIKVSVAHKCWDSPLWHPCTRRLASVSLSLSVCILFALQPFIQVEVYMFEFM